MASLSLNPNPVQTHTLNHKASRLTHVAHGSPLDQTIPTVLDDAVEALAGSGPVHGVEGFEIESPTTTMPVMDFSRKPSMSPPINLNSRSGSPVSGTSASPVQSPPILAQLSTQIPQAQSSGGYHSGGNSPSTVASGSVPKPSGANRAGEAHRLLGGWAFGAGGHEFGDMPAQSSEEVSLRFAIF